MTGPEIEKKSFDIINQLIGDGVPAGPERDVVVRVVHATADLEFAGCMVFSEGAVRAGLEAIRSGCRIVTDVRMLQAGISAAGVGGRENVVCHISDQDVAADAKQNGTTRAAAAMRKAATGGGMDGAIIAIGNAPTALYEIIRLVREGVVKPALIVGMPVGFVGAAESKEALLSLTGVQFITNRGRKGGSPATAAAINALIKLSVSHQGG